MNFYSNICETITNFLDRDFFQNHLNFYETSYTAIESPFYRIHEIINYFIEIRPDVEAINSLFPYEFSIKAVQILF